MLIELTITNFAIIDHLQLHLAPGFNVLTGETGAGKSIIIDAVSFLLGGRADPSVVRAGAELAQVEGVFRLDAALQASLTPILEREGLEGDSPELLILGRELRSGGRAYCRVNGRSVSLALHEQISQPLVDIHGQSEHLSLLRVPTHQRLLDRYAGLDAQRETLAAEVRALKAVRKELDSLLRDEKELARRVDQLSYQIAEIQAARLQPGEEENLLAERTRLAWIEERLSLIHSLRRKYGQTIHEILEFAAQAQLELERITHSEERIEQLRAEEERLRHTVGQLAAALSEARRAASLRLASEIEAQLADLNMAGARFTVELTQTENEAGVYVDGRTLACSEQGIDRVEFMIAPNPGEGFKPLVKIASGGETSRLMLALKTVLVAADETPTLIFDEIDQGIGGRVGSVVGRKLRQITQSAGRARQVLCVTHLPQIAGYADVHFQVEKRVSDQRTTTRVRVLTGEERVDELAHMLGSLSEATRLSAREIIAEAATGG